MLSETRVIVVGIGLMGGSMAKALSAHAQSLVAVDLDGDARQQIVADGVAEQAVEMLSQLTLTPDDLLLLCTPVGLIIETIRQLPKLAPDGCMLMDVGSTKWDVCRTMNDLPGWFQAIGGHPMCGKESSGYRYSTADLFANQTFILTPTARTTPHLRDIADEVVALLASHPVVLPPKEHDRIVALTSHLPYLIASTLMQQATSAADDTETVWQVSATGFRDTSRHSGSRPAMMRDILITNRQAVVQQLLRFQRELAAVVELVNADDPERLTDWLAEKRQQHSQYLDYKYPKK